MLTGSSTTLATLPDDVHLVLVGPGRRPASPTTPRAPACSRECRDAVERAARRRASAGCTWPALPMDDVDENAHLVNALQRHASVVVQKSLVEGFGLTVTEAMWKARPVVASAVGGIQDQIVDGRERAAAADPTDLDALAARARPPPRRPGELAPRLGAAARARSTSASSATGTSRRTSTCSAVCCAERRPTRAHPRRDPDATRERPTSAPDARPRRGRRWGSAPRCRPGRTRRPTPPSAAPAAGAGTTSPTATANATADAACPEGNACEVGIRTHRGCGAPRPLPVGSPPSAQRLEGLVHDQGGGADGREPRDRGAPSPGPSEQPEGTGHHEPGLGEVGQPRHPRSAARPAAASTTGRPPRRATGRTRRGGAAPRRPGSPGELDLELAAVVLDLDLQLDAAPGRGRAP